MNVALIVGHGGQDGQYLAEFLRNQGTSVIGMGRNRTISEELKIDNGITIEQPRGIDQIVGEYQPEQIYYLAAHHRSSEARSEDEYTSFVKSFSVHVQGLLNVLAAVERFSRTSRLFYAGSAHMFGNPPTVPQDETTPFAPVCAYGISKTTGTNVCRYYRRNHGIFCSVGILYNHESPRRSEAFVGRKIARSVAAIKRGEQSELVLGNLDAAIDWGAAPDYVEAMHMILKDAEPDDFIIASGELHTIGEFVDVAFAAAELDSRKFVTEDHSLIQRTARTTQLLGNPARLQSRTGWMPRMTFADTVRGMVAAELADTSP